MIETSLAPGLLIVAAALFIPLVRGGVRTLLLFVPPVRWCA